MGRPGVASRTCGCSDEVVRRGSFTGAAETCGYTQSGVSRRIAALERASGGALFRAPGTGRAPTPAGEVLRVHAVAVLAALALRSLRSTTCAGAPADGCASGRSPPPTPRWCPRRSADLRRAAPGVETTVTEGLSWELVGVAAGGNCSTSRW